MTSEKPPHHLQPQDPSKQPSKLFIRSEVMAVINFLTTVDEASKQDKMKQVKRLNTIPDPENVQLIILKELQRASQPSNIQIITELLMELGTLDVLHEPMWHIIENDATSDEIKDACNLILRYLGDDTDPNLYLNYLDDPEGLINRETERMLEVSARNPEALIDFIDFIFSLPVEEQVNLVESLREDYPPQYLTNIYIPALKAQPPIEMEYLLLNLLGSVKSAKAATYLQDRLDYYPEGMNALSESQEKEVRLIKKSLSELKLSGLKPEEKNAPQPAHAITKESSTFDCFATLPDGIGNQGIIISRQWENGDVAMMCVALNDMHGIIDCFGFYQLTHQDFSRICDKFHEEASKVRAPIAYCQEKLLKAEAINHKTRFRLPYEYSCWKVLFSDEPALTLDIVDSATQWANDEWEHQSSHLYNHPDFSTWFLEEGDHHVVTELLKQMLEDVGNDASNADLSEDAFTLQMDAMAEALVQGLLATEWRDLLIQRLAESAYLLHHQNANTFATLAGTEVKKLLNHDQSCPMPLTGFLKQYGRRCVEEYLLRLQLDGKLPDALNPNIKHLVGAWEIK